MNRSLLAAGVRVLSVSQFTLYADTGRGNRPGFDEVAPAQIARPLWEAFNTCVRGYGVEVATGIFGAHMQVHLVNDGPVTIILEKTAE